jgi:hypothetical protein
MASCAAMAFESVPVDEAVRRSGLSTAVAGEAL